MKSSIILLVTLVLAVLAGVCEAGDGTPANLFPNPAFDMFEGDLPAGWTFDSWNQPAMKVRVGKLKPGMDGTGHCLEIRPGNPMSSVSLTSPVISVSPGRDYLFKGYYASTCELVTTDKRWMNAEGVVAEGKWLDAAKSPVGAFTIVLPDTQDRWVEFYDEVHSPDNAAQLQIVITRRWVGGRLRFDDFSLREGRIKDFAEEFSIRPVPDEDFFPIFACLPQFDSNSDLQQSQFALANFTVGTSPDFGQKTISWGVPADDAELTALNKDTRLWWFAG